MRWVLASAISAFGFALWFLLLRPCFQLWVSFKAFEAFVILTLPWIVIFLSISLRGWKRFVIPPLLVAAAFISLMPEFNPMPIAATESGAVFALVRIRTIIENNRSGSVDAVLRDVQSKQDSRLRRFYRFEYEKARNGYRIAAVLTPKARSCGCIRNFVIGDDGIVHYTMELRAATQADPAVDIPTGLERTSSR